LAVKYWQIIADKLSRAGWSWGCVSALDRAGRTIWVAADEKLKAFAELERAIQGSSLHRDPNQLIDVSSPKFLF
jgi:hypothetical protein